MISVVRAIPAQWGVLYGGLIWPPEKRATPRSYRTSFQSRMSPSTSTLPPTPSCSKACC